MTQKNAIRPALFALGFLAMGVQILMLRECLKLFYGNELVVGALLSLWMLLTGAGAFAARFSSPSSWSQWVLPSLMLLLSAIPYLIPVGLVVMKDMLVPFGSMIGLWGILLSLLTVSLPFCLINGFLFVSLSSLQAAGSGHRGISTAYAIESLGSLAAGAILNFLLLWYFDVFSNLHVLVVVYLAGVLLFTFGFGGYRWSVITVVWGACLFTGTAISDPEVFTESLLYRQQRIICSKSTPYGQLDVTEQGGQLNYYSNGMLMFSGGNVISSEEQVHFAMVQHPAPGKVLLLSGGLAGTIPEILKYPVERIDWVELNPAVIGVGKAFLKQSDHPAVHLISADARKYIREAGQQYDVVLINLPEPSTLQVNRYYTLEFFSELKKHLLPGGVIALSLPTGSDYVSELAGRLNSSVYRTLKAVFREVVTIPADRNFFIASDAALSVDVPALIEQKGIPTLYVNRHYLDGEQLKERAGYLLQNLSANEPLNLDFRPRVCFLQVQYWLSLVGDAGWIAGLVCLALLLLIAAGLNPVSAGLFSGGFTAASLEVMVIVAVQVAFGFVYNLIGMVVTLFMLGLVIGSGVAGYVFRRNARGGYLVIQFAMAGIGLAASLILPWLVSAAVPGLILYMAFTAVTIGAAFLAGLEYAVAGRLSPGSPEQIVPRNYAADLFGSAAGAFIVALYAFPLLGLAITGILIALLNLFTAFLFYINRKNVVSL
jgi:spermidine synthase